MIPWRFLASYIVPAGVIAARYVNPVLNKEVWIRPPSITSSSSR